MFENKELRGGYFIPKFEAFKIGGIVINDIEIDINEISYSDLRNKSLVNRTADGLYKFSHKSILEYLIAINLVEERIFDDDFSFNGINDSRKFFQEIKFKLFKTNKGLFVIKKSELNLSFLELQDLDNIEEIVLEYENRTELSILKTLKNLKTLYFVSFSQIKLYQICFFYYYYLSATNKEEQLKIFNESSINYTLNLKEGYPNLFNYFKELEDDLIVLEPHLIPGTPNFYDYEISISSKIENANKNWKRRFRLIYFLQMHYNIDLRLYKSHNLCLTEEDIKTAESYLLMMEKLKCKFKDLVIVY